MIKNKEPCLDLQLKGAAPDLADVLYDDHLNNQPNLNNDAFSLMITFSHKVYSSFFNATLPTIN